MSNSNRTMPDQMVAVDRAIATLEERVSRLDVLDLDSPRVRDVAKVVEWLRDAWDDVTY